jgi:hypothetical protein
MGLNQTLNLPGICHVQEDDVVVRLLLHGCECW